MTPKERAAMQQALGALKKAREMIGYPANMVLYGEELALREALAEQAEREPVAWVSEDVCDGQFINGRKRRIWWECIEGAGTPFYAAPVRTKDLTDGELTAIWERNAGDWLACFRAVIAAFKEKNK